MENKNLGHTEFVNSPDKTFFLDLKKTQGGRNYLVITQSRKVDEENRERTRIILFDNEIAKFSEAMMRSLIKFSAIEETVGSTNKSNDKYAKTFTRWSVEDEQKLKELYQQGDDMEQLSISLERSTPAITARLRKLGMMITEESVAVA